MLTEIFLILLFLILHAAFNALQCPVTGSLKSKGNINEGRRRRCSSISAIISGDEITFSATMQAAAIISLVIAGILVYWLPAGYGSGQLYMVVTVLAVKILATFIIAVIISAAMPDLRKFILPGTAICCVIIPAFIVYIILYPAGLIMRNITLKASGNEAGKSAKILHYRLFSDNIAGVFKRDTGTIETGITGGAVDELRLYRNALEFTNVKIRDCMIPRPEIVAADVNSNQDELMHKFVETGLSKILIYEESIDNTLGYITSKELFGRPGSVRSLLHPIFFVTETMPASRLLKKFIQEKKGIAVVVDEFGVISGLVTIEDVIEEIFGEIEDEHDVDQFIEKKTGEGEFVFSGRLEIDYLNERYMLKIPDNEAYSTLAGFVLHHHGSIPGVNDVITIGSFTIKILKVSRNRIDLVKVTTRHERHVRDGGKR